ncbi:hypothetical protein AJ80_06824 [Polytolypa hystricis UAMH7299]|uniref:BTB domain-containing protein n=1 Tax=Polytolypa hystricis (strain UAMH7299) TaxID=1447883 RepID=A0A2B7XKD4_POLH7|nr:hypothetical protein AJ80_06824 [Polytolypa hystricis UAMH7299]
MAKPTDFRDVVCSPPFNFLVGKDRIRMSIHADAVKRVSGPLYALANDSQLSESDPRTAALEDVDEDTFVGFCQYVYTRRYATPEIKSPDVSGENGPGENGYKFHAGLEEFLATRPVVAPHSPFKSPPRRTTKGGRERDRNTSPSYEEDEIDERDDPADKSSDAAHYAPIHRRWERFKALVFIGEAASSAAKPDIMFHSKLFCFAAKYKIEGLPDQCLKSLHRDLCNSPVNQVTSPSRIIDLVYFAYTNTERTEMFKRSSLRDLVIRFLSCSARGLTTDERFRFILESNGMMASDLVAELLK